MATVGLPPFYHCHAVVRRTLYRSPDSSFVVLEFARLDAPVEFVGVGQVPGMLASGVEVDVSGYWEEHPKFGRRFRILVLTLPLPSSAETIRAWLSSGILPGIGPTLAARIVDRLGDQALIVLDQSPERLLEIEGVTHAVLTAMLNGWKVQRSASEWMAALCAYGLPPPAASRTLDRYGREAVSLVKNAPYRLLDIEGLPFERVDRVAQGFGVPAGDPERVQAGILAIMKEALQHGHSCLPLEHLVKPAARLLKLSSDEVQRHLPVVAEHGELIEEQGMWYCERWHTAEAVIEARVAELVREPLHQARLMDAQIESGVLTLLQEQAFRRALCYPLSIVTGITGTGKTLVAGAIARHARRLGQRVLYCVPGRRCVARAKAIAGVEAIPLGRALEWIPGHGCRRSRRRPLDADLVIVDDMESVSLESASELFEAIDPRRTALVIAGDDAQLPAAGPGQVLRDLVAASICPVTRLEDADPTMRCPPIIALADRVHHGSCPERQEHWNEQYQWYLVDDIPGIQDCVRRLVTEWAVTRECGVEDCQVLVPFRRGLLGTDRLNCILQDALAPLPRPILGPFRLGDRVRHTMHDGLRDIPMGEIGIVCHIVEDSHYLEVEFYGRRVPFLACQLDRLELAYCLTVQKAQGLTWSKVIVALHMSQYAGLRREVLYTAVTRATRELAWVGPEPAFRVATTETAGPIRYTGLFRRPTFLSPRA